MRWTDFFIPTVRETPADAVAPSHQLMLRAGLIRQVASGSYAYLPLGYRVLTKTERIIREELNAAGAIELHMPAMQPVELWQESNRVEVMGDVLIHLPDKPWRKGTVLGPTHEEVITDIARAYINSYKQLPICLYQIQTKFRDEQRPKSGVLRTREFEMMDAYSFDVDKPGLDASYDRMYAAYCRIMTRCGLPYVAVEADSGAIGGDVSHEFMVETDAGEDTLVRTPDGTYAANLERAAVAPIEAPADEPASDIAEVHTPGTFTIEQVSGLLKCDPAKMLKTIIYTAEDEPLIAVVCGDHEVNEPKLARAAGVTKVVPAEPADIKKITGADVGFAGPVNLDARVIVDQAASLVRNAVTGANKTDYHLTNVNPGRDFELKQVADIRNAVPGDRAENGQPLEFKKCIEVGHVFKLGTKYSVAMKANYLDVNGKAAPMIMGCYGIGVNRIAAAAIEAFHDDGGICWPMTIAPFEVLICALDAKDDDVMQVANQIHDDLAAAGVDVLIDDRDMRPGPKFKDADLIGIPVRLTVGKRGLKDGIVELKERISEDVHKLPPAEAVERAKAIVADALKSLTATSDGGWSASD
jgi:prolyl-tRNA synthetase